MDIQTKGRAVSKTIAYLLLVLLLALAGFAHAGTVTYVYSDPQGTPLAEADASGNITATFDYRPYGSQALGTAPSGPGYAGHVNDPDTGLVYMQARYYDSQVGRFISTDPIGPTAGNPFNFNRFAYANNSPSVNIDPDGRCTGSLFPGACLGSGDNTTLATATSGHINEKAPAKYQSVLNYGHISLSKNAAAASRMSHLQWAKKVAPGKEWDYKHSQLFANFPNRPLLSEFGNFHYGFTGAANGLSLTALLVGAGEAQVLLQSHNVGNTINIIGSAYVMTGILVADPNALYEDGPGRAMVSHGLRFGDNEDDSQPIIAGNDFYERSR